MKSNRSTDTTFSPWQQSFSTEASTDIVSSVERRQYNKALKAMYEIVRLGAKRLDTSGVSKRDSPTETTESSEDTLNGMYKVLLHLFLHAYEGGMMKVLIVHH